MSDDLVKQSIAELQDTVRCVCHEAYKGRGLHDPNCHCDTAEAVKAVTDRIEILKAENHLLKTSGIIEVASRNPNVMEYMRHWEGRAETAEAKLAKAVEALGILADDTNWFDAVEEDGTLSPAWRGTGSPDEIARATLAQLTGGPDGD